MAFFDTGALYDSGIPYDQTPTHPKKMPKAKLELKEKDDEQLAAYCANHKAKMAGNATFPAPIPAPAIFDAALADFQAKLASVASLRDSLAQAVAARNASRAVLEGAMTQRGGYVEITATTEAQMLSAGIEPRNPGAPVGQLPAPGGLVATMGDLEGEIDLAWNRVRGASSYVIDCRAYNDPTAQWQQAKISNKSSCTVGGLVSGKKYTFRVRAIGSAGEGAWSDEVVLMAP